VPVGPPATPGETVPPAPPAAEAVPPPAVPAVVGTLAVSRIADAAGSVIVALYMKTFSGESGSRLSR
jgi:hypothetical protein